MAIMGLTIVTSNPSRAADTSAQGNAKPYTVNCAKDEESGGQRCKVDKKTYIGWRTYHAFCHVCHAQDAVGSSFAPSLVDKLKDIDKTRFINSLDNGYRGQIGVMPAWKDNPNVSKRYEELYAYLLARADGELAPGRPQRLDR
jgi:hypothetical protein